MSINKTILLLAAAVLTTIYCDQYWQKSGSCMTGGTTALASNRLRCSSLCRSDAGCTRFSYANGACKLGTAADESSCSETENFEAWRYLFPSPGYMRRDSVCFRYGDISSSQPARDLIECSSICTLSDNCHGFSLAEGACHLQRAMEESADTEASCVKNIYSETSAQVNELLAQGKSVTMSSVVLERYAHHAVDGIYSGVDSSVELSGTKAEFNPWIEIDLLDIYNIIGVKVCARISGPDEASHLQIKISMTSEGFNADNSDDICAYSEPALTSAEQRYIPCARLMSGQHVRVTARYSESKRLSVVEIEVHGY